MQVRASFANPGAGYANESVMYLAEFNRRRQFRQLGYFSDMKDLDALTGEMFIEISDEISRLEEKKRKAQDKRRK